MAKSSIYKITSARGGISDDEDKGIAGAFKFASNLDIRKQKDTISCGQALMDIGAAVDSPSPSVSPSASSSPSSSGSPSPSLSVSPSASASPSAKSPSSSISPSASRSPSASASPSSSVSPSHSPSPSISPSAGLTTVFSDLVKWWVPCSDGNLYGFGEKGKIYKIDSEFVVKQVYDARQEIRGAEEKPSSSGKRYLVFATKTNLHIKEIPGLADWNDVNIVPNWPKTNLEDAPYHTMKQIGGDVYIANKSTLAFVGYDDSYTNEALQVIPGNIVKTIVERNGRAIMGTYREGSPTKGINAAIDAEVPLVQIGNDGEIFFANMADTIPYKRFPGGGKVNPGGVTNLNQVNLFEWEQTALSWIDKQELGNMAYWGVYGAESGKNGIYTIGRKRKDHPYVMNLEYLLDVDEIGAVTIFNGVVVASYKDGTEYGVKVVDESTKAQGVYEGLDLKAPDKKIEEKTVWALAEVYMKPLPTGTSVEFWYRVDKDGSFVRAKTPSGATSFSTVNGKKAAFIVQAEGEIFEPRLVLNPSGNSTPEIYRLRIYFS